MAGDEPLTVCRTSGDQERRGRGLRHGLRRPAGQVGVVPVDLSAARSTDRG